MYKSPIEIKWNDIVSDAVGKGDEYILRCVQQVGVNVDRDALIKALEYDRGQYEKGWNDRDSEIVRCKDCVSSRPFTEEEMKAEYRVGEWHCKFWYAEMHEDDYCSCGERRKDERT